jgi:hypothetical protein
MSNESTAKTSTGILVCQSCRKVVDCSLDDFLRFTRDGWPRCCGEVMAQYGPVEKTALEVTDQGETPRDGTKVE